MKILGRDFFEFTNDENSFLYKEFMKKVNFY